MQKAGIEVKASSLGTNDLTQTALGMSRDDSGSFLPAYTEAEIIKKNPFASIDQTDVGQLMRIAVEKGRQTRPDIKDGRTANHAKHAKTMQNATTPRPSRSRIPGGL